MSRSKTTALLSSALLVGGLATLALLLPRRIDRALYNEVRIGMPERELLSRIGPPRLAAREGREIADLLNDGDSLSDGERQDQPDGSIHWYDGGGKLVGKTYRWSGSVGSLSVTVNSEGTVIGKRYAEWDREATWGGWLMAGISTLIARLQAILR